MTAPDLSQLTTAPNQIRSGNAAFNATGQNDINTFNNAFSSFINDPKNNLTNTASNFSNQLGLPTLRANANTLNTEFANIPATYRDASRGFDVNNNQLSRIVGQKAYEMSPAMTTANNALASGESVLNQNMQWAGQDVSNRALPYQSQQALLSDRLARESTMFSQANQQELDGLIAKINAGVTLSNAEAERANQLSIAEKGYENAKQVAGVQNTYFPVAPGGTLYNAGTSKPVVAPPGYKAPGA